METSRTPRRAASLLLLLGLAACASGEMPGATAAGLECRIVERALRLPPEVDESSGLAESRRTPGVFWTHNDSGGDPVLFAVDARGRLLGTVTVAGAENRDWEDVATGPCPAGTCLYVADTGDNEGDRRTVHVYRIPEPAPNAGATAPAERITLRYPRVAHDAEAIFVLPDGALYLVTKGRRSPVEVYRAPAPLQAGGEVVLQRVGRLSTEEPGRINQVTGAAATPDGKRVVVRTYTGLYLFRTEELLRGDDPAAERVDLAGLGEPQGEAVEIRADGTVFLTSESPGKGEPATMARLACDLP
ncbi:MAG TPA: hypothetical protein VGR37_21360 [Longimicrobiaceae bacterium]|nr:hypothetical protein [Longimicrobiaceae bacterium]